MLATSWLVIAIWCSRCGEFSQFCFFMLPSGLPKLPLIPPVRGFPVVWKLLLHDSHPTTGPRPKILCPPFRLYPLPCVLPRRLVCLSGCLGSSASLQKLFCGSCSMCRWSFDVFVGNEVVSLSCSSTTLGHLLNPPSSHLTTSVMGATAPVCSVAPSPESPGK